MIINLSPRICRRFLLANAFVLALFGLGLELLEDAVGDHWLLGLYPVVSLQYDHNLPTWVLTGLFALAALLCGLNGEGASSFARYAWRSLALAFVILSLDAAAGLGGLVAGLAVGLPAPRAFAGQNLALFVLAGLLIAACLTALVLAVSAFLFFKSLPRGLLIAAALAVLVFAAAHLGREAQLPFTLWYGFGGAEQDQALLESLWRVLMSSLKIAGASLLCAGLIANLAGGAGRVRLKVVPGRAVPAQRSAMAQVAR